VLTNNNGRIVVKQINACLFISSERVSAQAGHHQVTVDITNGIIIIIIIIIIWFVRLLALRPLLAYCARLG
jgi:hypothetical protein